MAADTALLALRAVDPAALLEPLPEHARVALRDQAMSSEARSLAPRAVGRKRAIRFALALAVVALLTTGIAWAAGALSPLALFQANPESNGSAPGGLWDQKVIAGTV